MLSIVIPCYNEEESVPLFYAEATKVLAGMGREYELLFVNDGSSDDTLTILRSLASKDPHVKYISFSRNFGKEAAMYAGFCNAKGDYVVVTDADLQDPPSLLPEMMKIIETGEYDSVATRRSTRKGESKIRSFFAKSFYNIFNSISNVKIVDGARDFRLMRREMVDAIVSMCEYNRFSKGIFSWVGFRTYWLSYENIERARGSTKWSFWSLSKYAMNGILNFSSAPLLAVSWGGVGMTFVSLLAIIYIVIKKLIFGNPVSGWASTACIIVFIGGVQLFALGIIGQYIARMYEETKHRPHYIVSETNLSETKKEEFV